MPPDSEFVAPVSIIEPDFDITENYGVLVGRTLVDTSDWSASVLLINPGSVVFPSFSCVVIWYLCRRFRLPDPWFLPQRPTSPFMNTSRILSRVLILP